MTDPKITVRNIKTQVRRLLARGAQATDRGWKQLPVRKAINALISFLYSMDQQIKWSAVRTLGSMVAQLADEDLEAARIVIRRLMWNLNDESGGVGWGSAEAMGEILARHDGLAREFAQILLSYAREDGNLLENPGLLQGVMWGLTRLAEAQPELLKDASRHIAVHLQSPDEIVRTLAVELLGLLGDATVREQVAALADDQREVALYLHDGVQQVRIADVVRRACNRLA